MPRLGWSENKNLTREIKFLKLLFFLWIFFIENYAAKLVVGNAASEKMVKIVGTDC